MHALFRFSRDTASIGPSNGLLLRSVNDSFVFYSSLIPSTTKLPVTSCVKFKYSWG